MTTPEHRSGRTPVIAAHDSAVRDDATTKRGAWRATIDSLSRPAILATQDGRILRANPLFAELAGRQAATLEGLFYWEVFPRRAGPLDLSLRLSPDYPAGSETVALGGGVTYEVLGSVLHAPKRRTTEYLYRFIDVSADLEVCTIAGRMALAKGALAVANSRLEQTLVNAVKALAGTMQVRDPYTAAHQTRVVSVALAIADELGTTQAVRRCLELAGLVHDLGKHYVPVEFLLRPGPLNPAELSIVRQHSQIGYELLRNIEFDWPVPTAVHQHHERLDGSGYPLAVAGEEIGIEARVLAVADTIDAMVSHRPYRIAMTPDMAFRQIERVGGAYDRDIVDAAAEVARKGRLDLSAAEDATRTRDRQG
ncbi:MAG: HD domain-containing protein [Gammaproteobacteria bacterium]|nr:HD domain-containing protein [Gammaproteobacteria bacterium]MBI5615994.1 HD domain-containing protein [Gammaproteobacteria bacterium]